MKHCSLILLAISLAACTSGSISSNEDKAKDGGESAAKSAQMSNNALSLPLDADPLTYADIDFPFGKDAQHIFCDRNILSGADVRTFTFLSFQSRSFYKDKSHVYAGCDALIGLDPESTVLFLPDMYLKDRTGIYDVAAGKHVSETNIPCDDLPSDLQYRLPHCGGSAPSNLLPSETIPQRYSAEIWHIGGPDSTTVNKGAWNADRTIMLNDEVTAKIVQTSLNRGGDVMWANCSEKYTLSKCESPDGEILADRDPGCGLLLRNTERNTVTIECVLRSPSSIESSETSSLSAPTTQSQPTITTMANGWLKYQKDGVEIRYPSDLIETDVNPRSYYLQVANPNFTVLKRLEMPGAPSVSSLHDGTSIDGLIQISVATSSDTVSACLTDPSGGRASNGMKVSIDGNQFVQYDWSDAGLGNRLGERVFSTVHNNRCYRIEIIESGSFFTVGPNVDQKVADDEAMKVGFSFSAYDVFAKLTPVAMTFRFISSGTQIP